MLLLMETLLIKMTRTVSQYYNHFLQFFFFFQKAQILINKNTINKNINNFTINILYHQSGGNWYNLHTHIHITLYI